MPNEQCSILNAQCNSSSPSALSLPSFAPSALSSNFEPRTSTFFHRSRITIHDAIRDGLAIDPAELQAGLNDPEAWAQEYLCEFMDNSTVLLPYDLIETCESDLATERSTLESLSTSALPGGPRPELFAGIDFARKNHLTVCWILEKIPAHVAQSLPVSPMTNPKCSPQFAKRTSFEGQHSCGGLGKPIPNAQCNSPSSSALSALNPFSPTSNFAPRTSHLLLTREVLCLRNLSTPEQLELLLPRLRLCQRICLDYTGPGIGFGDYLHREFNYGRASVPASRGGPTGKVELCTFTSAFKAELFPRLAAAFESRQLLIPIGRDIREDLHSIYRTVTNSGQVLYRAHGGPCGSHSDGHADRTTALALALRAAQTAPISQGGATTLGRGFRMRRSRAGYRYSPPQRTLAIIY